MIELEHKRQNKVVKTLKRNDLRENKLGVKGLSNRCGVASTVVLSHSICIAAFGGGVDVAASARSN